MTTKRPVADIVVLIVTAVVAFAIVAAIAGVIIVEALHPDVDTEFVVAAVTELIVFLAGALVGRLTIGLTPDTRTGDPAPGPLRRSTTPDAP